MKLTDIPDDELAELLPSAKKLAIAAGADNYNILQNNGRLAHQVVDHVHVHMVRLFSLYSLPLSFSPRRVSDKMGGEVDSETER